MIFPDKKKVASIILSRMGKDGVPKESKLPDGSGSMDEYSAFAEDMLDAFKSESVERLAKILKSFHEMIKEEDVEQDSGE
jgi:hypothetical protein